MSDPAIDRLLFVFQADAGLVNAFVDSVRKALRLRSCTLCALTHGLAGERPEWATAKASLPYPIVYLHRDEIDGEARRVARDRLPCVLTDCGGSIGVLIEPDELDACGGRYDAFERLLRSRVAVAGSALS
jgi:hypothetical protein